MVIPNIIIRTHTEINIKKRILAIDAAPASIFVNPKIPATIATIKNMNDHFNMTFGFK